MFSYCEVPQYIIYSNILLPPISISVVTTIFECTSPHQTPFELHNKEGAPWKIFTAHQLQTIPVRRVCVVSLLQQNFSNYNSGCDSSVLKPSCQRSRCYLETTDSLEGSVQSIAEVIAGKRPCFYIFQKPPYVCNLPQIHFNQMLRHVFAFLYELALSESVRTIAEWSDVLSLSFEWKKLINCGLSKQTVRNIWRAKQINSLDFLNFKIIFQFSFDSANR